MGNLLSYFSTPPNNKFLLQEILLVIFQWISFYLRPCFSHHIQHSHFPWRARRRCGTAWGRRRRSSWCGRGCTWPACWWRIWPEDRRHSRASTAPVHSNSISEEEEEERTEAAQHPHKHKHNTRRRTSCRRGGLTSRTHPRGQDYKSILVYLILMRKKIRVTVK